MNIRPNRMKQRLAAGQVATILSGTNDADMIDQLGPLGAEGIWLEGEHGGVDYADLGNLTRACDLWGMTSVVRVMDNDYATIYRTLDRGAQGIVVPHVNTRREAEAVVEAGKFAPLGKRGMFTSRQGFGVGDYLQTANDQSLLIVLIEDIAAVRNLDDVLKVDHIDVFFVAPSDLATSMGQIGNMGHPEVQKTIDAAITKVVQAGRVAGTLVNADNVERYTRLGVRCIMTSFFPWIQAGATDAHGPRGGRRAGLRQCEASRRREERIWKGRPRCSLPRRSRRPRARASRCAGRAGGTGPSTPPSAPPRWTTRIASRTRCTG